MPEAAGMASAVGRRAELVADRWKRACAADERYVGEFVGSAAFVRSLARTIREPQVTQEGPVPSWETAVGELGQGSNVSIVGFSRQMLHLEDVCVEEIESSSFGSIDVGRTIDRVRRAIYWALETRASYLARELDRAAHRDPLTSLFNRQAFDRDCDEMTGEGEKVLCIAVIDLDGLKQVNDTDGHEAGDQLIKDMGAELSSLVSPGVNVYRWGGDEFAVLSDSNSAEELQEALSEVRESSGLSFSFGVATWPSEEEELPQVIRLADQRMYEQKESRKEKGYAIPKT